SAPPEPRPHYETDRQPRALVLDMRDRPGVDQGAIGGLRRNGAPAGRLAIDVCQHAWAWSAGAQSSHVRDTTGHVQAGISVGHAHAPPAVPDASRGGTASGRLRPTSAGSTSPAIASSKIP